jgi:murein peptide amidase A
MDRDAHPAGHPASIAAAVQRLGRNLGGYYGETIEIDQVIAEQRALALQHGWTVDLLPASPGLELLAFRRAAISPAKHRIYLSTGIHGDEPAGPLALRELLKENDWPTNADLWICPCLNPTGFPLSKRECAQGADLNRDYRNPRTDEVRAHIGWLEKQPRFDLCLCLHEDWEAHGFYVYELNPDQRPSLAPPMVEAVRPICPVDPSTMIDGREARDGIIRPNIDPAHRAEWAEAFYLYMNKTRLSYTTETPSDFPLTMRTQTQVAAVRTALAAFMGGES